MSEDLWAAIRQRDANINAAFAGLNAIEEQLHEMRSLKGWRLNLIRENLEKTKAALRTPTLAQASTELCDCGYAEDVQERIAKLQSEAGFYQCLYESAVKRLEHIAVVCTQQMDRDCNHRMALDGVRQIANDYLALPSAEGK